jgi:ABC-2 type transport system permease protein
MKQSNLARDTMLLFWRGFRAGVRTPVTAFIFPIALPLLTMLCASEMNRQITALPIFPEHPYIAYLSPGILLLVPMIGTGYAATGLVVDVSTGFLDRIRLVSTRPSAVIFAKLLFEAVRVIPAGAVVLDVSVALGARLGHGVVSVAGVLGLMVLWSIAYSGIFYFIGLRTMSPQAPIALLPLAIPVLLASPTMVPRVLLSGWLHAIAGWNPYTYLVAAARTLMAGTPIDISAVGKAVAISLAILVITQSLVMVALRKVVSGSADSGMGAVSRRLISQQST